MQLLAARSYPAIDTETLMEYVARDTLFRTNDGSFFLYMASERPDGDERILFLECRDALVWLNEGPDEFGSFWDVAASSGN